MVSNSEGPVALNDRGVELFNQRRFEEAFQLFVKALALDPQYGKAWLNQANSLLSLGRQKEATHAYERAVDVSPLLAEAWFNKAQTENCLGFNEKASDSISFFLAVAGPEQKPLIQEARKLVHEIEGRGVKAKNQEAFSWLIKGYRLASDQHLFDKALACFESCIQLSAGIAKAWQYKAMCLHALKRPEEAMGCYGKAIEIDPQNAIYWFNKGSLLVELRRFDEAIDCYTKAIELNPQYLEAWNNKGNALRILKRFDECKACLQKAVEISPTCENAWFNKALAEDQLRLTDEAVVSYKMFLSLASPHNTKQIDFARKRINDIAMETAEHQPSRPSLPNPSPADPKTAEAWNKKGIALVGENRAQDALACFEKAVELDPRAVRPLFNKAIVLSDLRRDEEALQCYDSVLEMDPGLFDAWLNKGVILKKFGRLEEALSCFEKAHQLDPGVALAWFNKGKTLADLGRMQEAIESYERALKIDPKDANALNNKGNCLQEMGHFAEALASYERVLLINSNHAFAWNNKGEVLNKLSRFNEAIRCFDRALAIKTFASPWHGKGESLRNLGHHTEAIHSFRKALEIYNKYAEAWYGKALSEDSLGLKDEAIHSYKNYLALSPKRAEKEVEHARKRLVKFGVQESEHIAAAPESPPAHSAPLIRKPLPKATSDFIGQKYEIYRVLGKGGFGVVYQVYSHETQSVYALKTFRDEYVGDEQTRALFRKEAQTLVDMGSHPYLVKDYFVEEISGRLYIAMEFVAPDEEGLNTLEAYLQRRSPDLQQTLRWAIQFCHGMEYANSQGVRCHRDIKPANVMIDQQKRVKISDFGLAGLVESLRPIARVIPNDQPSRGVVTMQGASFGTPTHMPPEQFEDAASCDERSDIYSFGIVLFQMVSRGSLPFLAAYPRNDSPEEWSRFWNDMHMLHLKSPAPRVNSPLFPVIDRCLKKKREERYVSFRELRSDLEPLLLNLNGEKVVPPLPEEMNAAEWLNKGLSLKNLGRFEEAVACYDKTIQMAPAFQTASLAWSNKGTCFHLRGRFDEAIRCFDKALEINPKNEKAWCNKGFSLDQLGRFQEALKCLDKALEVNPHLALAWSNKAFTYIALKDYEKVILCSDMALKNDPKNEAAWINKGVAFYSQSKMTEAMTCYHEAFKINPREKTVFYNIGLCLGDLNRHKDAIAYFDKAIASDPRYEAAWACKGQSLNALSRPEEAISCFDKAIEINPKYSKSYYLKGYALINAKRKGEAKLWFQKYLSIAPPERSAEIEDARRMLRMLGAIVR